MSQSVPDEEQVPMWAIVCDICKLTQLWTDDMSMSNADPNIVTAAVVVCNSCIEDPEQAMKDHRDGN